MWLLTKTHAWMKPHEPIRMEMLLWASEAEPQGRRWPFGGEGDRAFSAVIGRLTNMLPDLVESS